jgi:hypothetical protein
MTTVGYSEPFRHRPQVEQCIDAFRSQRHRRTLGIADAVPLLNAEPSERLHQRRRSLAGYHRFILRWHGGALNCGARRHHQRRRAWPDVNAHAMAEIEPVRLPLEIKADH